MSLQEALGFTDADKAAWLEANGRYYADPEQGWQDKLRMHAYPQRSASVYVMPSYQSPVTNQWIDTPRQRREDLKRTGSRPWEGKEAETREAAKHAREAEAKLDAQLDHTVRSAWRDLPDSKKQAITQGL